MTQSLNILLILLLDWGLTSHQNRSYRDSETKENVEVEKKETERRKRQEEDSDN